MIPAILIGITSSPLNLLIVLSLLGLFVQYNDIIIANKSCSVLTISLIGCNYTRVNSLYIYLTIW